MRTLNGGKASRIFLVLLAAAMTTLSLGSASAQADDGLLGLSCGDDTSHPFMRWADPMPYTLVPDGGFERGARGWTLEGGARVVNGNEPFGLSGNGNKALSLPAGSSATSAPMCVGLVLPTVRFVSTGGAFLTSIKVEGIYRDAFGQERSVVLSPGALPGSEWGPTLPLLQLGGLVNAATLNGVTTAMRFRFTPIGVSGGGNWKVDSVFVDPWKSI